MILVFSTRHQGNLFIQKRFWSGWGNKLTKTEPTHPKNEWIISEKQRETN